MIIPDPIKRVGGRLFAAFQPQCRFDKTVFLLGHMRCGSTALSHVICGHPAISGYGEAHIDYAVPGALGILALNQRRRQAWKPQASRLFDKILHNRYDAATGPAFFTSTAIFVVREPAPTIRSIRQLFREIGSDEYATDALAADYYLERLATLARLWARFPEDRRIGCSYETMVAQPGQTVDAISDCLGLNPPLENAYDAAGKVARRGAGDPLAAHLHSRIEHRPPGPAERTAPALDLPAERQAALADAHRQLVQLFGATSAG